MQTAYLAGPIAGLGFEDVVTWRDFAIQELRKSGIVGRSPMRAKEFLEGVTCFSKSGLNEGAYSPLSTPRGITTRDRFDATHCDVLLVNLLGAKAVSIGTCLEIAWADANRIPIVCAMESQGNPHDHGMINEIVGYRVETLEQAIFISRAILEIRS